MSNKYEATFHPLNQYPVVGPPGVIGPPPQAPAWADLTRPEDGGPTAHAYLAAQHGWDTEARPNDKRTVLIVAVMLLAVLVGALAFIARSMNVLPAGVPVVGMDSGVAACQAIAKGGSPTGGSKGEMTEDQYADLRSVFADSRYPAIRDNGVRLIDIAWQVQGMTSGTPEDEIGLGILAYVGSMTEAYTGLTGGCAEHGYTLPALTNS